MRARRSRYPTILPPDKVKLPVPVKRESFDVERPGILLSSKEWAKAGTVHKVHRPFKPARSLAGSYLSLPKCVKDLCFHYNRPDCPYLTKTAGDELDSFALTA